MVLHSFIARGGRFGQRPNSPRSPRARSAGRVRSMPVQAPKSPEGGATSVDDATGGVALATLRNGDGAATTASVSHAKAGEEPLQMRYPGRSPRSRCKYLFHWEGGDSRSWKEWKEKTYKTPTPMRQDRMHVMHLQQLRREKKATNWEHKHKMHIQQLEKERGLRRAA